MLWAKQAALFAKLPKIQQDGSSKAWRKMYLDSARKLDQQGYEKFKDQVWVMPTSDGLKNVVIPGQFLAELNKLPGNMISFPDAVHKLMEAKYTKVDPDEPLAAYSIKADLNPALSRLSPIIFEEVERAIKDEITRCPDWTPVFIYPKLINIIAKVSGRIFVGPELSRDKDYLDTAVNYTTELVNAIQAVKSMKPWLRPFFASRLPEVRKLREREELAEQFFEPIIQARRNAAQDPHYEKPNDMLQWFLDRSTDYGIQSTQRIVKLQLLVIFGGIHNTTVTATNILYNLAVWREYLEPLREEVHTVVADTSKDEMNSRALQRMEKLDSFMKETTRFYPPETTSFSRKTAQGITLSNGQYIPPGSLVETPSDAIAHDETTYSKDDRFDGFRFYKIRQGATAAEQARNQFVTSNDKNLVFGYGKHACPGRFLAAAEIKLIIAKIILRYEFRNETVVKERYPSHAFGRMNVPDASKPLLFKERKE
ncbi:cytochrome P450 [Aspergillus melleus]|uniref:cytochrome P450 n=1 Tax=Aspergillus melleus TaxID=138277 RepID=UPI001E8ED576|nr:uncharacterized protein LDX57_008576 [Aspergillus melleus]KAH8430912.1 hypothetical protein LDX57_008576 [Aspergillus melleus]